MPITEADLGKIVDSYDGTYDPLIHSSTEYVVRRRVVTSPKVVLEYEIRPESGPAGDNRTFYAAETPNAFVVCKGKWRAHGQDFHGLIDALAEDRLDFVETGLGIGEGTAEVPIQMEKLCYGLALRALKQNNAQYRLHENAKQELEKLGILGMWDKI